MIAQAIEMTTNEFREFIKKIPGAEMALIVKIFVPDETSETGFRLLGYTETIAERESLREQYPGSQSIYCMTAVKYEGKYYLFGKHEVVEFLSPETAK